MPASKPNVRGDLTVVEIDQEAIVYDPRTHLLHYLNPMASLVLQLCDGTATVKETIAELAEVQEVRPEDLAPSVQGLLRQFRTAGIVTPSKGAERALATAKSAEADERETIRREVPRSE